MTRNRILGAIGVVWGAGIVASKFMRTGVATSGAYAAGQNAGFIFGGLMFAAGLYYLIKG